jgi:hypothetical protein
MYTQRIKHGHIVPAYSEERGLVIIAMIMLSEILQNA